MSGCSFVVSSLVVWGEFSLYEQVGFWDHKGHFLWKSLCVSLEAARKRGAGRGHIRNCHQTGDFRICCNNCRTLTLQNEAFAPGLETAKGFLL